MQSLELFLNQPFIIALKAFFKELNIPINYIADEPAKPIVILGKKNYNPENFAHKLIHDVYALGVVNDAIFEGTTTFESIDQVKDLKTDYDGLLIFGVTLHSRSEGLPITRSQLAEITRAFNRAFPYTPVTIVFKYDNLLSFANSERIPYKQSYREGEKVGKVSLLRDIDLQCTHRGHKDILNDLKIQTSGKNGVNSFASLYKYWQEVFSVSILNKKFYKELQTWYFWAIKEVTFPNSPNRFDYESNEKFDEAVKEHKGKNVIRLLTRILFIWFIKEKRLIPEQLFDEKVIAEKLIKDFTPQKPQGFFATGKNNSTYYRAILQNLFFATLNQEMGKRAFRSDGQHQNVTNLMRYKSYFKDPDYFVQLMEEVVPFMNGGLFECLDKPHPILKGKQGGDVVIYNDGFSDRDDNLLVVPDFLFFDVDEEVDLSDDFGNKVFKNSKTRGLIEILESYKFTITENTPIEEDVALDPELLGKVFENLLASYNPETKTTARKQTGSFYTPREIVNYMVDESLIAYLKNKITDWNVLEEKLDEELHQLLSYDNSNPYSDNPKIQTQIIKALDQCTILDPACGSGAFPMGILQKMVHVLHKVDPNNTEWKLRQIDRVNKAIENLEEIDDAQFREQSIKELKAQIKDIEDSFENNELDYGRKLYLIENCIYGVDIQSIATQISKLRFFISLIVDQKIDKTKENFGIRPLPNLETKFVAANTLIDIEKPNAQLNLFENQEIKKLETELKKVRHKLFSSKSPANKRKLREEDKELRSRISDLLVNDGWNHNTALQLASWDPYDQNESSSFFDPEWMFDIVDGFDVVIGNPPYKIVKTSNTEKSILKKYAQFYSADFKINLYSLFLEISLKLGKNHSSIHCYIIPDTFLNLPAFKKVREVIAIKNRLLRISYYNDRIFENAEVGKSIILNYQKETSLKNIDFYYFNSINNFSKKILSTENISEDSNLSLVLKENKLSNYAFELLQKSEFKIRDFCDVYDGINPGSKELKDIFINTNKLLNSKKVIDGKDFNRYSYIDWSGIYVQYDENLVEIERNKLKKIGIPFTARIIKKINFFEKRKVITRQTADTIIATLDYIGYYTKNSVHSTLIKIKYSAFLNLELICAIYNSKLIDWFYKIKSMESGRLFPQVKIERLNDLPIPNLDLICLNNNIITQLCKFLLFKFSLKINEILDSFVFNLYFPDHMKERGINVIEFIEKDIEKVMQRRDFESLSAEEKENVIEKLNQIWSNPENEVIKRINLFKEKSPDILKPILES